MYSTVLMVAFSTVGFFHHKCHGAPVCAGPSCAVASCAVEEPACFDSCAASACSCAKVKRHKCGLFKRLFHKKCHCACSAPADCSGYDGCSAPVECSAPAECSAPVGCSAPAPSCACPCADAAPAAPAPVAAAGFKVERSALSLVAYREEKATFSDEPIVIFARN